MRNDLQIIQSAIADADYKLQEPIETFGSIRLYKIKLPERYRGLLPVWYFGVFNDELNGRHTQQLNEIISDATKMVGAAATTKHTPLVIISDNEQIDFPNYLDFPNQDVFFLNHSDLPAKNEFSKGLLGAPFIRAVRNKIGKLRTSVSLFTLPYSPNKPAQGWRFFGRKKEIEQIVSSPSNFILLGTRRIGKTSLLKEVEKRYEELGHVVYNIDVQGCVDQKQVLAAITSRLAPKDVYRARQYSDQLGVNFIHTIIKKLKRKSQTLILILDEIGNVVMSKPEEDWRIFGVLRELSIAGDIKVIISAYQEQLLMKTFQEFEGPFINFGTQLKLKPFSPQEIEEFLLEPLGLWGEIGDKKAVLDLIITHFGNQPFVLQYLGDHLFRQIFDHGNNDIQKLVLNMITGEDLEIFESAINETFSVSKNALVKYIFLRICAGGDIKKKRELSKVEITYEYLDKILDEIKVQLTFEEKGFLLMHLETRGLLVPDPYNKIRYHIASPILYAYLLKYYNPIEDLIKQLYTDVSRYKNNYINEIFGRTFNAVGSDTAET